MATKHVRRRSSILENVTVEILSIDGVRVSCLATAQVLFSYCTGIYCLATAQVLQCISIAIKLASYALICC